MIPSSWIVSCSPELWTLNSEESQHHEMVTKVLIPRNLPIPTKHVRWRRRRQKIHAQPVGIAARQSDDECPKNEKHSV